MLASGFVILSIALIAVLIYLLSRPVTDRKARKNFIVKSVLLFTGWLGYITLLSIKGVFISASLPPRIPLLLVFPTFGFMLFFFKSKKFTNIIKNIPVSSLVFFQSFRIIVELLLLGLFLDNKIPKEATFEGYNFDIIIGISAPLVGWLAYTKRISKQMLLIWNILGLITLFVVVFIFMSQSYFPSAWHAQESILANGLGLFPYTFLPGVLMPAAVFMHLFTIVKIKSPDHGYLVSPISNLS